MAKKKTVQPSDVKVKSDKKPIKIKPVKIEPAIPTDTIPIEIQQIESTIKPIKQPTAIESFLKYKDYYETKKVISIRFLDNFSKRAGLSLTEYIILLIIQEFNIQGKLFSERNEYFSLLLHLKDSSVEKALHKLLSKCFIGYVDEDGYITNGSKTYSRAKQIRGIKKIPGATLEDLKHFAINSKREFIVTYYGSGLHSSIKAEISEEYKKEQRSKNRVRNARDRALKNIVSILGRRNIDKTIVSKMVEENYRLNNKIHWEVISSLLEYNNLTLAELVDYMNTPQ